MDLRGDPDGSHSGALICEESRVPVRFGRDASCTAAHRREAVLTKLIGVFVVTLAAAGCAALENLRGLVQAPKFEQAPGRDAEIRMVGPSVSQPLGGAAVRIYTQVTNPNTFGLTLGTLRGTLHIEGSRAADVDFPLGLPLRPSEETTVPIDLAVSFSDLPGLANVIRRAIDRQPLEYQLDGTIGVDAGRLGQPTFGPMTILHGELRGGLTPSRAMLNAEW
jgi:hypothetical protein